ncbi:hypothetical protein V6N13_045009 [Hibiscus sabdariffa]
MFCDLKVFYGFLQVFLLHLLCLLHETSKHLSEGDRAEGIDLFKVLGQYWQSRTWSGLLLQAELSVTAMVPGGLAYHLCSLIIFVTRSCYYEVLIERLDVVFQISIHF